MIGENENAAANKELVRRFYKEVYVDWNMALRTRSCHLNSHLMIGHKAAQPVRRRRDRCLPDREWQANGTVGCI